MRVLRLLCALGLLCGLGAGVLCVSEGCDSTPGDGSEATITAAAKQQAQDRGEKMKELMAKKTAQQHRRR
jgi:hypothetical protein